MAKDAKPGFPIHELLHRRWSPRAFDPNRTIEPEKLHSLLEAARWAPSSNNEQPWAFIVATRDDRENFDKILSTLAEKNQTWARHAGALMISVAERNFARNNLPNRHAFHDVGQAVSDLVL